jgi:hypothetical protein
LTNDSGIAAADLPVEFYASDGRYWLDCEIVETVSSFHISQRRPGGELLKNFVADKNDDVYFFSSPLHSAPLYRDRVWKTFCPWQCADSNHDLQALSSGVIEGWVDRQVRRRIELLEELCAGGISLVVIEPPKPLKRSPEMLGIRPDVLIAASHLYRRYVSGLLDERSIPIIRAPDETYDGTGFTKSAYEARDLNDYHHGNALFGSLAMKKIINFAVQVNLKKGGQKQLQDQRT